MGMFFLVRNLPKIARRTTAARRLAELMGFGEPKVIVSEDITLYLYPKLGGSTVDAITFPNGDFAAACGTFLFSGSVGAAALHELYAAFSGDWSILDDVAFSFVVIIRKNGCRHFWPVIALVVIIYSEMRCSISYHRHS